MPTSEISEQIKNTIGFYPDNVGQDFEVDLEQLKTFSESGPMLPRKDESWRSWPTALTLLRQAAQKDLESCFPSSA